MKRLASLATCIAVMMLLFGPGRADVLDPQSAPNSFLSSLEKPLNGLGIDVVLDNRSGVGRRADRPIVASLTEFQTSLFVGDSKWVDEFRAGAVGAVVAVPAQSGVKASEFDQKWKNTRPEKRVFISFAREDVEVAHKLKATLEQRGFVAFVYLAGAGDVPTQSPEAVGRFLKEARIRLVVDTEVARRKPGVLAEALVHTELRRPEGGGAGAKRPDGPDKGPGKGPSQSQPDPGTASAKRHIVEIYGADRCPRTRQALELFGETNAKVVYHNVDTDRRAQAFINEHSKYLLHGDTLPLIKIDGEMIHPTQSAIGAALKTCQ